MANLTVCTSNLDMSGLNRKVKSLLFSPHALILMHAVDCLVVIDSASTIACAHANSYRILTTFIMSTLLGITLYASLDAWGGGGGGGGGVPYD